MNTPTGIRIQPRNAALLGKSEIAQSCRETVFNPERVAEKVKSRARKLIEETTMRYLENFPDQSDRDASILWRLAFAYENRAKE